MSSNAGTPPLEPEDYYLDEDGLMVFTSAYHLKRGYCCQNRCRHCPYGNSPSEPKRPSSDSSSNSDGSSR